MTASRDIPASTLTARIEAGTAPVLLDVRSRREFARGHVPGARHIPFWAVPRAEIPASEGDPIVLYCGHGPRATLAAIALRLRGFRNVALLQGHMAGWKKAGEQITKSPNHQITKSRKAPRTAAWRLFAPAADRRRRSGSCR